MQTLSNTDQPFWQRLWVQVVARVAGLFICLLVMAALVLQGRLYASMAALLVLIVVQVIALVRYLEQSNRNLTRFIQAIRFADFSQSFDQQGPGKTFNNLYQEFGRIISEFQLLRARSREQALYLRNVVRHLDVALLCFTPDGRVDFINQACLRLLGVSRLTEIHSLSRLDAQLVKALKEIKHGQRALVKVRTQGRFKQLVIAASEFKLKQKTFRLVSLQDIRRELEATETEAWQNLTRVMTHEIMNSMTPIASLAATVLEMIAGQDAGGIAGVETEDIQQALHTIQKRSQGLMRFVRAYRNLTLMPKPEFRLILVTEIFTRLSQLMEPRMTKKQITYCSRVDPPDLEVTADGTLLEQVLINLLLNALDAVQSVAQPRISLHAGTDERDRVYIAVEDNGCGIEPGALEKIFIPFFSTKKKGSGIGLSFSRQVMHLHKGSISVDSKPYDHTRFRLVF